MDQSQVREAAKPQDHDTSLFEHHCRCNAQRHVATKRPKILCTGEGGSDMSSFSAEAGYPVPCPAQHSNADDHNSHAKPCEHDLDTSLHRQANSDYEASAEA